MQLTKEEFADLLSIVDAHAGKTHSQDGMVAESLSAVLARYEEIRRDRIVRAINALRDKGSGDDVTG